MNSQAQNAQPAQNHDDGLGRGKRTKQATAKGQAYANVLSAAATARALSNTQSQAPAIGVPTQSKASPQSRSSTQSRAPTQSKAPPQSSAPTQAQPQTAAATLRRSTRNQAPNQGIPSVGNNPRANNAQWQPNNSGQGNGSASSSSPQPSVRSPSRRRVPQIKIHALMIKIYEEIHRAASDDLSAQSSLVYDAREFLFEVRLRRFLDLLADNQRQAVEAQLRAYDIHHPRAGAVVGDAQRALDFPEPARLTEFCNDPKLSLLMFCAHSPSFRDVIKRSDADSGLGGLPYWRDIFPLIKDCTSSLELFARSYDYDWESHLRAFEKHFETILENVYRDDQKSAGGVLDGVYPWTLGIAEGDFDMIHEIPDDEESHIHHHWALPKGDRQPAVRPSIEYTVTRDMWRTSFTNDFYAIVDRPKPKNWKRPAAKPDLRLPPDSKQTMKQLDITKSVFLDLSNHQWPNGGVSANAVGFHDYCGAPGHPCIACGVAAPNPIAPEDDMVVVDGDGRAESFHKAHPEPVDPDEDPLHPNPPEYPCHCTLKELMAKHNSAPFTDPDDLLVELFTTEDKQRGVRSLQHIPKGTYIGNYIGEIYPELDMNNAWPIERYGPPDGNGYHFSVPMGPPPHPADDSDHPIFTIDSAHLGNWTRFMNHSCSKNVRFEVANLGQRWAVLCQTTRDIRFRQEVTTDYGPDYFYHLNLDCRCGHSKCKYKNVTKELEKEKEKKKREREEDESGSDEEDERPAKRPGLRMKVAREPPLRPAKKAKKATKATKSKGRGEGKAAKKGAKRTTRRA